MPQDSNGREYYHGVGGNKIYYSQSQSSQRSSGSSVSPFITAANSSQHPVGTRESWDDYHRTKERD